ncbi:hypothetical protein I8748_25885 [Nostoc sp. CENA67]|uniref:Uncharacterized protein n=1 Tax=Amazonocrinis nigriterrae CENA67 TaxID=2794033 RepID=A0A8J7HY66_9NOST|nr:hypothetical protein [Amazonocrinis nigriterrae]MBH8565562.1 hypothetical protein [Amazonocrinis nigriterrae CENA67]
MNYNSEKQDFIWKQYYLWIELYKFYFESAFKANTLFFAVTGGILTFYFSNPNKQYIKYSLLLPSLMSASFLFIALYGVNQWKITKKEFDLLAKELELKEYPDLNVLTIVLLVFAIVFFLVLVSLSALLLGIVNI